MSQAEARSRPPLFVTRKFPPSVGGMETLSIGVWRSMSALRPDARLIAHGGRNAALVWWLPFAVMRVLGQVLRRQVGQVITGDALTHAFVWPFARALGIPCSTMVMGLDVTYRHPFYRALALPPLRRAGLVISISRATADAAVAAGVDRDRTAVLRLGVPVPEWSPRDRREARRRLWRRLGLPDRAVVLVLLGRLVPRKGAAWFVERVLPGLPDNVHLVVAGDGPDRARLGEAIRRAGLEHRVHLLGRVDDDLREDLLTGCDVFVQPNVAVPGDMEGFGLVVVEAAVRGATVVAADLEGLRDAVVDGVTGNLLASGNAEAWARHLGELVRDGADLESDAAVRRDRAVELYGERAMARELGRLLGL